MSFFKGAVGGIVGGLGAMSVIAQAELAGWSAWVGSVGFPIAVTGFLLVRMERQMKEQSRAIHRLALAVEKRKPEPEDSDRSA